MDMGVFFDLKGRYLSPVLHHVCSGTRVLCAGANAPSTVFFEDARSLVSAADLLSEPHICSDLSPKQIFLLLIKSALQCIWYANLHDIPLSSY